MYKSSLVNQWKFCLAAPFMCSELSKGGLLRGFAELSQPVPIQFMAPGLKLTSGKRLFYFTLTFILQYLPGDSFLDMFYYYTFPTLCVQLCMNQLLRFWKHDNKKKKNSRRCVLVLCNMHPYSIPFKWKQLPLYFLAFLSIFCFFVTIF